MRQNEARPEGCQDEERQKLSAPSLFAFLASIYLCPRFLSLTSNQNCKYYVNRNFIDLMTRNTKSLDMVLADLTNTVKLDTGAVR